MMHRSKARLCHAASPCTQECSWTSTHPASQRGPGVVCRLVLGQLLLCDLAGPDPTCRQAVSVTQPVLCVAVQPITKRIALHCTGGCLSNTSKAWLGFC